MSCLRIVNYQYYVPVLCSTGKYYKDALTDCTDLKGFDLTSKIMIRPGLHDTMTYDSLTVETGTVTFFVGRTLDISVMKNELWSLLFIVHECQMKWK